MKLAVIACLLSSAFASASPAPIAFHSFTYGGHDEVFAQPVPPGHFLNPILTGYFPDPTLCRVGADYYLVTSTFAYFPGLPIFHSRDLVNWEQIGHAVDRPTQLNYDDLGVSRGLFAPALSWHDGVFFLTCTHVDGGGNFLLTATDPAGPWSDPIWFDFEGIDPSLFFDDDGRAWMLNNGAPDEAPRYNGHRAIWIQEFDLTTKKLIGPRRVLVNGGVDIATKPVWIEGPHLYKKDGWYYLCCAEGGTSVNHSQVILRSRSVTGPFEPWRHNPILTQRDLDPHVPNAITCTGHADLFIGPDNHWWATFLACRPYAGRFWQTGRETFLLPVDWPEGGWPTILPRGERVPFVVPAPTDAPRLSLEQRRTAPVSGNFTLTDSFDRETLPLHWFMLRTPKNPWWRFADGKLLVTPQPGSLADKSHHPAFLARRVHHANFEATVRLEAPRDPAVRTGLVAFQSESQHDFLGVIREGDSLRFFVERRHTGQTELLAETKIAIDHDAALIALTITNRETKVSYRYRIGDGPETALVDEADSYPLTVQAAGGGLHFTGLVVGVYAQSNR